MHFRTLGVSILALGLAACGGQDEPAPAAPTPAPEDVVELIAHVDVSGAALGEVVQASEAVEVTVSSDGVLLSGSVDEALTSGGMTGGAHLEIGAATGGHLTGQVVTVNFTARTMGGEPARMAAAYSTHAIGNSGWQYFDLSEEFQDFSFEYAVPEGVDPNPDYLGFWPIRETSVELASVSISTTE